MRKIIESIDVTVTYRVGLGNVEVDDNVYQELMNAADECSEVDYQKYPNAAEWLRGNIKERDCCDWCCEIEDIQDVNNDN